MGKVRQGLRKLNSKMLALPLLPSGIFRTSFSESITFCLRQKKTIETLRRERAERLHNFRRTRSFSPQKQLGFLPNKDLPTWEFDLPSRRREYLQQLRKDVVETTR